MALPRTGRNVPSTKSSFGAVRCLGLSRTLKLSVRAQAPLNGTVPASSILSLPAPSWQGELPLQVHVKGPEPVPGCLPPPKNYENVVNMGVKKANLTAANLFVSGILAGMFIAVGGFLACSVAGGMQSLLPTLPSVVKLMAGLVFPVGLTLVLLSGTELYTGNTAIIPMAVYEGKANWGQMFHNWFWVYAGNFVGSILMAAAVYATGTLAGNPVPATMAVYKTSIPFGVCVLRAMICNWLVCMAIWQAAAASTVSGKMLGLWGPIATFVTIGLEHSVANMFFIPMGILMGAKVSLADFLVRNLLPVTLGNTLAGFLFVGTAFAFLHGSLGKPKAVIA